MKTDLVKEEEKKKKRNPEQTEPGKEEEKEKKKKKRRNPEQTKPVKEEEKKNRIANLGEERKKKSKGAAKYCLWVSYMCLITILSLSYELWKLKTHFDCFQFP